MVDALFHMQQQAVHQASMDPDGPSPNRAGRHFSAASPAGTYKSPEGWIVIMCLEAQMPYLWAAMGRPDLADDPRFDSLPNRLANNDALTALIEDWMAGFSSDEEVMRVLEDARVPHAPSLSPADALTHPHFVGRGVVRHVQDPLAGDVALPGFPFRSTDPLPPDHHSAPALGEHNHEILVGMLGMESTQVDDLESRGILSSKPY